MGNSDIRGLRSAPLVGRDPEMETLGRLLDSTLLTRETRAVTLLGPAGVGKNRIVEEFSLRVARDGKARVVTAAARDLSIGHGAYARLLRARFGLDESATPEEAMASVRDEVATVLEDRKVGDVCYFIGHILELKFADSPLTKAVSHDPREASQLRRVVLRSFFESDATRSPLVVVVTDLHLADDDSLELFGDLVENSTAPILFVGTMLPELLTRHPRWIEYAGTRHTRLEVGPLADARAFDLMQTLLARCEGGVPKPLVDAAVSLAGGNPGLLGQVLRVFHDAGVLESVNPNNPDARWRVHLEKLDSVHLPMSAEEVVDARTGMLSKAERRVLEHAAAMGSVFWVEGLVALRRLNRVVPDFWTTKSNRDVEEIRALLGNLARRDYVLELTSSGIAGSGEYCFKHNLERERLAALTGPAAARAYHRTLADWLAHQPATSTQEEYLAILAHQLELAGATVQAGTAYLRAADLARKSFAAKKAHDYYAKGLEALGDADAELRIEALHNQGDVLVALGKTEQAFTAFREMLALAFRLNLMAKGGAAHNRIGRLYRDTGLLTEAMPHLETALSLFQSVKDERGVAACHDDLGKLLWARGEYDEALKRMKTALEMRKQAGDRRNIALSFHNIGLVWRDHGRPTQAQEALEAALTLRREINDPIGIAQTLNGLGRLAMDQRDLDRALGLFHEAYEVAKEIGERNRIAILLTNVGEAHYRKGDAEEAIRVLREAEELCDELGDRLHLAEAKRGLAKAYLMQKELRKARTSIKHAVDLFGQVRSKSHLASALRTLGEITAAGAWGQEHEGRAVDYFMRSIGLCKEIGNEFEIAKSYRAFSDYVSTSPHYKENPEIQREAVKLSQMADEIFERNRIATESVP